MSFTRLAGLAALTFAVVVATINIVLGASGWPPSGDAAPGEVAAFLTGHSGLIGADVALTLANTVLIVVFGAGAFAVIWPAERDRREAWSVVGLLGAAIMSAQFGVVVAIRAALSDGADPAGVWDVHNALFTAVGVGLGTIMLGFSIGGTRTATIRRWHGGLGVLSAVLLTSSAVLAPLVDGLAAVALVGFAGWLVWLATFGVVLVRLGTSAESVRPASAHP
jgi:hypothetical protein